MPLLDRIVGPYRAGLQGLDRRIHAMVLGTFLAVAARMMIYTFLVIYFVNDLGISAAVVGLAYFAESAARAFSAPYFGALTDRIGRRKVLMPALVAQAFALPAFLFVEGPVSLFVWSLALGFAGGAQIPATSALLLDLAPAGRRQGVLSLQYTALSLGYTVGVAPAGYLALQGFETVALLGFLLLGGVVAVYAFGVRGELPRLPAPGRGVLASLARAPADPTFLLFVLLAIMFPLSLSLMFGVTPLFATDEGLAMGPLGLILSVNGLVLVVFSIPVAARTQAVGPFRWLGWAGVWVAGAFLFLGLVPDTALALLLATCIFTVGELWFGPVLAVAVAELSPPGERGAYQGAWSMVASLAFGAGLALASLIRTELGWRDTWLLFAAVFAIASEFLLVARRHFRRVADARAAATEPATPAPEGGSDPA